MFPELMTYKEIAEQYDRRYESVRRYAMRPDWPPAERQIGSVKFFVRIAVADFFKALAKKPRRK
jgi:hypothetical protein